MPRFSTILREHFLEPRNRGSLPSAHAVGHAAAFDHGPRITLYLRLEGSFVSEASFDASGCGVTIAAGSMLTEVVRGKSIDECRAYTPNELADALGGIPPDKAHSPIIAVRALQEALASLANRTI